MATSSLSGLRPNWRDESGKSSIRGLIALVMIVIGYRSWRASMLEEAAA